MSAAGEGEFDSTPAASDGFDSALAAFTLMLGFLQKPADAEQLRHAAGKGGALLDASDLLRLAKQLDVRAREVAAPPSKLARQPLPAIAATTDGHFFLILQATHDKVLVFHPQADKPQAVPLEALAEHYSGKLILMTTRPSSSTPTGSKIAATGAPPSFGSCTAAAPWAIACRRTGWSTPGPSRSERRRTGPITRGSMSQPARCTAWA